MEYDLNNNLTLQTDAKGGQTIAFTYDALNRVTSKVVAGTGTDTTTYCYDGGCAGHTVLAGEYPVGGQLLTTSNAAHTVGYGYGIDGQVVRESHVVGGADSYELSNSYHPPSGALLTQTMPDSASTTLTFGPPYRYDAAGRMTSVGTAITQVTYDIFGNPTATSYGSGAQELRTFDPPLRLWVNTIETKGADGNTIDLTQYIRTATGRVREQKTTLDTGNYVYTYDYAGRLLMADHAFDVNDLTYTYDAAGNLRSKPIDGVVEPYLYGPPASGPHPHAPTRWRGCLRL